MSFGSLAALRQSDHCSRGYPLDGNPTESSGFSRLQSATSDCNYDGERNVGGPPCDTFSLWRCSRRCTGGESQDADVGIRRRAGFPSAENNALEFWTELQCQRVPSKLIAWPNENHWILNAAAPGSISRGAPGSSGGSMGPFPQRDNVNYSATNQSFGHVFWGHDQSEAFER